MNIQAFFRAFWKHSVIFFAGLLFLGIGILAIMYDHRDIERAEVTGQIVKIVEDVEWHGDEPQWTYDVYVNFTDLNGKEYENVKYPYHDGSMREGGTVTVLYNVDDPLDITSPDGGFLSYYAAAVGSITMVVAIVLTVKDAKREG